MAKIHYGQSENKAAFERMTLWSLQLPSETCSGLTWGLTVPTGSIVFKISAESTKTHDNTDILQYQHKRHLKMCWWTYVLINTGIVLFAISSVTLPHSNRPLHSPGNFFSGINQYKYGMWHHYNSKLKCVGSYKHVSVQIRVLHVLCQEAKQNNSTFKWFHIYMDCRFL